MKAKKKVMTESQLHALNGAREFVRATRAEHKETTKQLARDEREFAEAQKKLAALKKKFSGYAKPKTEAIF
jgi:hypothetical protein